MSSMTIRRPRMWVSILIIALGALLIALPTVLQTIQQTTNPGGSLEGGEICEAGKDCTCGFVTCSTGCKCEKTGSTGICVDCPIPTVDPSPSPNVSTFPIFWVLGGLGVLIGGWLLFLSLGRYRH